MIRDEQAIRTQREGWKTAFENRDVEGIMRFYAPDVVLFDMMPPLQFVGEQTNRDNWVAFFGQFDGPIEIEFADEQVTCAGDLGFVHQFTRVGGSMRGKPYSMWTRETNCLRKAGGQWLITHAHASIPVDFESNKPCTDLRPDTAD